ncbi:TonB-dependent receptor [Bacteroides sp. BFG-551]|nr:TonB-dependent receptor [Bacteroides sp. BFG-551]
MSVLDISLIKNKLNLALRSGMDMSNDFRTQRKPFYSNGYMSGMYKEQTVYNLEMNNDFLLSYKDRFGDFDINASLGGNSMYSNYRNVIITASRLLEPGIYMLRNSDGNLLVNPTRRRKGINSFYGFANIGWRNMLYLELTGRNDWSSTLAPGNNSYFYPSVNVSVLLDEVFNLHQRASWIDMLKIRGSWANVGNDTDPYELEQVYNNSDFVGSYLLSNKVQNYNLKPENVESWEFGLEARMFKNRLGLDFTFYNTNTTDQIINVPADYATGASSRIINAGKVNNKGIEISANIKPVRTRDWKWNMTLNWSKNWNKLVELAPGVNLWQLNTKNTIGQRVFIYAYPGKELGRIYGTGYERAPEGAFYWDENGNKVDCSDRWLSMRQQEIRY